MALTRRERTIATIVLLLLGALALDRLLIEPGLARWDEVQARLVKVESDLVQPLQILERETAARASWQRLEARLTRDALENVLHTVDHLEALASTAGTSFQKMDPAKHVDVRGDLNEVSYDMQVRCPIRNLNRLLYEIDASPELLKVRRLNVSSRSGATILDVDPQVSTLELTAAAAGDRKKPSAPVLAAEESAHPPKKPFSQYKLTEERNIFAPRSLGGSAAAPSVARAARLPLLTGIVYDRRRAGYRGLLETPGQAEPQFVGPGEATPLGRVLRVTFDQIVLQGDGKEVVIPLGSPMAGPPQNGGAALDAGASDARGADGSASAARGAGDASAGALEAVRDTLDQMKAKLRKNMDKRPSSGEHKEEAGPPDGIDEGGRSALKRMRDRLQRKKNDATEADGLGAKPEPERAEPADPGQKK